MPAARKHATLAVASVALLAAFALAGSAGSVRLPGKRDREAPTAPANIRVSSATPTTVSLAWDPSTDNVGVAFYNVYVDARRVRVSGTAYTATNLECGQSVGVWIVAYDFALNRSSWSATATVSTAACVDTQPPTPPSGFRQAATTETAVVLEWNESADDVGVVEYGVYRDQLPVQSPSQPTATLTGLRCGSTFEYQVDAADAAGNRSVRRSAWVQTARCSGLPPPLVDSTPPSQPRNLGVSSVTASSVSLTWSPSTDDVGVLGYDVYENGTKMASVSSTSSTQDGLACGTSYWFGLEAFDRAGNRSDRARVNATTSACLPLNPNPPTVPPPAPPDGSPPADENPPTQPANLGVSGATRTSVSLTWDASTDNLGVAAYRVYVDGIGVLNPIQPGATVTALSCGTALTIEVDAADAAGNRSTRARVTASTAACPDTQAPTVPTNVAASSRTATSIALWWSASTDNVGVAGYGLYRNGTFVANATGTTGIFSNLNCNTNYTLAVDAFDAAGNKSGKATVMVATTACADTSAPTAPTNLTGSNVTQSSVTVSWNASSDNVGVAGYDVLRNGTKMASVTATSSNQTGLACATSYWFGVEAYDAAGNRSARVSVNATTSACPAPPPPSAPPPDGTQLFDGGFDTGNTSQWNYVHRYAPERYMAVTSDAGVNPRKGSHMARVEVRPNEPADWCSSCNVALAQKDDVPGGKSLGDDVYTGFSVYLPNGFPYVPGTYANNIVEWHTTPPMSQAPIHFFLDGTQGGAFTLDLHTAPAGYSPIRWKFGDLVTGRWADFVFRTKWKNDNTGVIEGWMDGTKRFSWSGLTWGSAVTVVYPEAGYYRANYGSPAVLYIDAFKVGTSYSAVAP